MCVSHMGGTDLQVTGLAVSDRHPYMFSAGLDKMVKCWDLEYNKVRSIFVFQTPQMLHLQSVKRHSLC